MGRLDGRLCVITGVGRGIGRAVARRFLDEGAELVVANRSRAAVEDLLDAYPRVTFVEADMTKVEDIDRLAAAVAVRNMPVYSVLPVVGGGPDTTVSGSDEVDFDLVMDLNVKSAFLTVQRMLPFMQAGSSVAVSVKSWMMR